MKIAYPLLILLITHVLPAQTLNSSLTACYALDNSGAEPVSNLTATLSAVTGTLDRFGNTNAAMYFNGTTGCFVKLPDNPLVKPSNALTFAVWVKPQIVAGGAHIVYTRNNQNSNFEAYQMGIYANSPYFRLNKANSTQNNIVFSTVSVTPNQWYHVVCTIDNTSLALYVNGVLQGTTASTFNGYDYMTGKNVFIGNSGESFNLPYQGTMDNLRFWNRVLSASEILSMYNSDPSCGSSPVPVTSFQSASQTVCAGGVLTFTDNSSNTPTTWNWQVSGATTVSASVSTASFVFPNAGVYSVSLTASNGSGMGNTAIQSVTVFPNPVIAVVAAADTVCTGQSVNLSAAGAVTFTWSTMQIGKNIQVKPLVTTVYSVTGQSISGCKNTATVQISIINSTPIYIVSNPTAVCAGGTATLTAVGAQTYTWNNFQTGSSIQMTFLSTGTVAVTGSNGGACNSSTSAVIPVNPIPSLSIMASQTTICIGSAVQLNVTGANNYTWSNGQTGPSISISPSVSSIYVVNGSNIFGCTATSSTSVIVDDCATGISEQPEHIIFSVYPAPASNVINIETSRDCSIEIRAVDGTVVLRQEINNGLNHVDVSHLANGMYFISSEKNNAIRKLIVQHH